MMSSKASYSIEDDLEQTLKACKNNLYV